MDTSTIKEQLHQYIETAPSKKLEALFSILEDEMAQPYEHWQDAVFVAEMKRREQSFTDGTAKLYSWEQVQARAEIALQKAKSGS